MTADDTLTQVNATVNKIPYGNDVSEDDWTPALPTSKGDDCDSSATAKMQMLYDNGWPIETMRLATCWTERGEYHCVLLVELDGQTWVLDNRQTFPIRVQDLATYKWHKLQIAGTTRWEYALAFIDSISKKD